MTTSVYIIESSAFLARTLKRMLSKLKIESTIIQNLESLENNIHSINGENTIVLTTLVLDDAPDGEVLDILQKNNIPTIVMSANYCPENRKLILSYNNVIDYLIKSHDTYNIATSLVKRLIDNQKISVLLCEDIDNYQKQNLHLLNLLQFNVLIATNKDEALAAVNQHKELTLVFISSKFANDSAYELTYAIREKRNKNSLGIIGICENDHIDAPTKFIKHDANDFVKKPFMREELIMRSLQTIYIIETVSKLHKEANFDFLTSLMNRRHFFEKTNTVLKKNKEQKPFAFAMLDIDHFKSVNDTYGHDVGDAVLCFFSKLAQETFDENKMFLARLGGEEFAIMINQPYDKESDLLVTLELFREKLEASTIKSHEHALNVTVSIGCVIAQYDTIETYMKEADLLLYKAKENGRNQLQSQIIKTD